jgi:hypothetical protein
VAGPDRQRPELVEREAPVRGAAGHLLDAVELGVLVRVGRLLPGPRALQADTGIVQDLAQPFSADHDPPVRTVKVGSAGEVGGELAQAPPSERVAQLGWAGGGRRDDERDVVIGDQAGTASRPPRVQRGQPPLVEGVHHVADGVLVRRWAPSAYLALLSTNANAGSNWGGPPLLGIILTHR